MCWRQFTAQQGDGQKLKIAPLNVVIIISWCGSKGYRAARGRVNTLCTLCYLLLVEFLLTSSSSSFVEATATNKLIILSLLGGWHCHPPPPPKPHPHPPPKNPTYLASLEALDTKVLMVVASTVLWGRLFQSRIVRGRNNCCWYCVRHLGCTYW